MRPSSLVLAGLVLFSSLSCKKETQVSALPDDEEEQSQIAADAEFEACVYETVEKGGPNTTLDVVQATCCAEAPTAAACKAKTVKSATSTLKYRFHNNTGEVLHARMAANTRHVFWPSATDQYEVGPGIVELGIQCDTGEEVCWGVWKPANKMYYWGAGPTGDYKCTDCCTLCDGSTITAGFVARTEE